MTQRDDGHDFRDSKNKSFMDGIIQPVVIVKKLINIIDKEK